VLIFKDDRAAKRPVNLGLRGNAAVEILGGLSLGDVVIPQNSGVVTGQRIRAVLQ
jgi:HlyD family secretion protein